MHGLQRNLSTSAALLRPVSFVVLALLLSAGWVEAAQQIAYGSYSGNGSISRLISDVGFEPDFVLIKSESTTNPVVRISSMPFGMSKMIGNDSALGYFMIAAFDPSGFWISNSTSVNQSGRTYRWVAVQGDTETLKCGEYTGNGDDDRSITGLGLDPKVVMIFPSQSRDGCFRTSVMPSGDSCRFGAKDLESNHLQRLRTDGFEVGDDNRVNENGRKFYYVAWAGGALETEAGTYVGNGQDGREIEVSFDPGFLLLKQDANDPALQRSDPSLGDVTFSFGSTANFSNGVQDLGASAFEIGGDDRVNKSGGDYYWFAWSSTPSAQADLAVSISADPSTVDVGDSFEVTANVVNEGPSDAVAGLTITIPPGLTYEGGTIGEGVFDSASGAWTVDALSAGATATAVLILSVDSGQENTTQDISIVVVDSTPPDPDTSNDSDTASVRVLPPPEADIRVAMVSQVAAVNEGDIVRFTLDATNLGPRDVASIEVQDVLPVGLTLSDAVPEVGTYAGGVWSIGPLSAGTRVGLEIDVEIDAGTAGTTITNVATSLGSEFPDPNPANDTAGVTLTVLGADLFLTHDVSPGEASLGESVTYTTTVSNEGPDKATLVEVDLEFPAALQFESAAPTFGTFDPDLSRWTIEGLETGAPVTLSWKGKVLDTSGGSATSAASIVEAVPVDPFPGGESDVAVLTLGSNELTITKTVDNPAPSAGSTIRYEITVGNAGTRAAASVRALDLLPAEVTYLSHSIVRLVGTDESGSTYVPATGVWSVGDMAPGASARLTINASVEDGTEGKTFTNTASLTGPVLDGDDPADNQDSAAATVRSADLALSQLLSASVIDAGDGAVLTVTVENGGPSAASGVIVDVVVPSALDPEPVDPDQGSFSLATGEWTVGALAAGEEADLVILLKSDSPLAGDDFQFHSTVSLGDPTDPDAGDNTAVSQLHISGADLAVTQTVSDAIVLPGDVVDFVITVTNLGPDTASDIIVRDVLPTGLALESATPDVGSYDAGSGHWSITSLVDGDSVDLVLRAAVTGTSTVVNQARRMSSSPVDPEPRNDTASEEVGSVVADLDVSTGASASIFYEGTTGSLTVSVANLGPNDATDIVVQVDLPAGLELTASSASTGFYDATFESWSIPSIADGESASLTLEVDVPLGTEGSWIHGAAILSTAQVDPVAGNDSDESAIEVRAEADLGVTLEVAPNSVREGEVATLHVSATNLGPSPATGVAVHLGYSSALSWKSHQASQGTFDPIAGVWTLGSLSPEGNAWLDVEVLATSGSSGSTESLDVMVSSLTQEDPNGSNDEDDATLQIADGLVVVAFQGSEPLIPGGAAGPMLSVAIGNGSSADEVLQSLQVELRTVGDGSVGSLIAEWQPLELWSDGELLATVEPGAAVTFSGLEVTVPGNGNVDLEVRSGASLAARDGDELDLWIANETSFTFGRDVAVDAIWPLDPVGAFLVDGLSAAQVQVNPVAAATLLRGGEPELVADLLLPGNGYDADRLSAIRFTWSGTAEPSDLVEMAIWADGGDGVYLADREGARDLGHARPVAFPEGPGVETSEAAGGTEVSSARPFAPPTGERVGSDDTFLGIATLVDDRWEIASLDLSVPSGGRRVFVTARASLNAVIGSSFTLALGLDGIEMESANDGPVDSEVPLGSLTYIGESPDPVVSLSAIARSPQPLLPGAPTLQMLRVRATNEGPGPITLRSMTVRDASIVIGSDADRDRSWSELEMVVSEALVESAPILHATMVGGTVVFSDLAVVIAEGASTEFAILGAASTLARDGDALGLELAGPEDLVWNEAPEVAANWPITSTAPVPVDGMSSTQIEIDALVGRHVPAGTSNVLVAGFTIPANGYAADTLTSLAVVQTGDATVADIVSLELFAGEASLGFGAVSGSRWSWAELDVPVPAGGLHFSVEADVDSSAVPGHRLRFSLPAMPSPGVRVESGNDGPRDIAATQSASFEIAPREGVVAVSVSGEIGVALLPGATPTELLRLRISNDTVETETLEGLTFALESSGFGTSEELARNWSDFELWLVSSTGGDPTQAGAAPLDGPGLPVLLATMEGEGDEVEFSGLALELHSASAFELSFRGGAQRHARDGDRIDPRLVLDASRWVGEADVVALGSLDPPGDIVVDGMSAAQIQLFPVEAATFEAGSIRNLALDFVVPSNGYLPDRLERLNLRIDGSAVASDISALELWRDDGDGLFSPDFDDPLGTLRLTGDRWELTGLDVEIPVSGQRFFVSLDVDDAALEGRSLGLVLPSGDDVALGMGSGNDGPRDTEAGDGVQHVISSVDRIALSARAIVAGTVYPGQPNVPLLQVFATNTYADDRTVDVVTLSSRSSGLGTTIDLDLAFDLLLIYEDSNRDGRLQIDRDRVLGSGSLDGGTATFSNLDWTVRAAGSSSLFVVGRVSSRWAHDGDEIGIEISNPLDIGFQAQNTSVTGSWPLVSGSRWVVDGMVAASIVAESGGTRGAGPGQGPVLAFDFSLPANGYVTDELESLILENAGSAREEIASITLWRDGGDGSFADGAGDDELVGAFQPAGSRWVLEGVSEPLSQQENRFYAAVTASEVLADSVSVALLIPRDGVGVASGNDGPYDADVRSPISVLLSDAPMIATLVTSPGASNVDQLFTLTLVVENRSEETIESISPGALSTDGDGEIVLLSGPTPSSLDLDPGHRASFVWQLRGAEPGTIEIGTAAEGRAESDGATLRSLRATAAPHELRVGADGLSLFALGSLPVTLSYGQAGVVPLSFTFRNPGESDGSDIELSAIRLRVEDADGESVVPADLFERVIVNEGNRIYYDSVDLSAQGGVLDLVLGSPVIVTTTEPTTLSLRFDLLETSVYDSYRVIIEDASGFSAFDATSGVGVPVSLVDGAFPLVSGLARLVPEATAVEIRGFVEEERRVGPGARSVDILRFEAVAGGGSGAGADSRVGSFSIDVFDGDGQLLDSAGSWIERIRVATPLQSLLSATVDPATSGDSLVVRLSSPLTLPANTPVPITVSIDVRSGAAPGELRFALGDPASIDVRDANTGGSVPILFEGGSIDGPRLRVESPATEVWVAGTARLPEQVSVGTRDLEALDLAFTHPGAAMTSRVSIESLTLQLWNGDRTGLVPSDHLSRVEVWRGTESVGDVVDLPGTGTTVRVPVSGVALEPGETIRLTVGIGIESTAPTGSLELTVGTGQATAIEVNGGGDIEVVPAPGSSLPAFSGLTQVTSPARELAVEWVSHVPAALVRDGNEVSIGALVLGHPSAEGSGPIQIESLRLRGAGSGFDEIDLGGCVSEVSAYQDGRLWAVANLDAGTALALLAGDPLEVSSGEEIRLDLRVRFLQESPVPVVRFGMQKDDIGIAQPQGALFEIEPRAKAGTEFPLWTESGSFGPVDLEGSYANFPNPFAAGRESTTFVYYLPGDAVVGLRIWTLRGDEVVTLLSESPLHEGLHQSVHWDGRNGAGEIVRNGIYLAELDVRISGTSQRLLRKVAVVR